MTKIQLKRSSALNNATTSRAPSAAQLDYGELAINYNSVDPQFFIKDSSGSVIRVLDAYAMVDGTTFTGDVNFDGNVKIKGDSTNGAGKLTLSCETDTYSVNIKAPPTSAAASYTLTLPSSAGSSNQVLVTDGSGGLSWALSSMTTADKNKLDGIESGATADQTGAEIKTLYEAEADTNAFTDALLNKLNNIASGAQVNVATNLGKSTATTSVTITSSTGTDVTIGEATGSIAGMMTTAHHNKLDGIESGATADQTAAEILTAIKTVDGSGSGLDADTLDGVHASGFLVSTSDSEQAGNFGDLILNQGAAWIKSDPRVNEPGYNGNLINMHWYASTSTGGNYGQVGHALYNGSAYQYLHTQSGQNHIYINNNKVWNAGNDGAGSGLDADLLDGYHQSSFVRLSANSSSPTNGTFAIGSASSRNFIQSHNGQPLDLNPLGNTVTINGTSNTVWHAGNDGSGSGLDADTVDGVHASQIHRSVATAGATVGPGWITVATNTSGRKHGEIIVSDAESGDHGFIRIDWMRSYADSNFTVLNCGGHSNRITGARVLYQNSDNTYGEKILQVYVTVSSYYRVQINQLQNQDGWAAHTVHTPVVETPSGYSVHGNTLSSLDTYGLSHEEGIQAGGHILAGGNVTAYSDIKLKENIEVIPNALDKVSEIRGVTFDRIDIEGARQSGVIAQEVEEVLPEVVSTTADGIKSVAYGNMVGLLIEAIKELKDEVRTSK